MEPIGVPPIFNGMWAHIIYFNNPSFRKMVGNSINIKDYIMVGLYNEVTPMNFL
jgi:hypothetical protein